MPAMLEMKQLHAGLMQIVEGSKGVPFGDLLVLRLAAALTHYGQRLHDVKRLDRIRCSAKDIHDSLRDYIAYALPVHLNLSLPDPLDHIWNADLRLSTSKYLQAEHLAE